MGCGARRDRRIAINHREEWDDLVTVDNNANHNPDVVHDLEVFPWPFPDSLFDEVHAYEVIEHLGQQGDYRSFFRLFEEIHRVLRPSGAFAATCPSWRSMWAWGDPSHRRVLTSGTLVFLNQQEYVRQVGKTPMSDFRYCYRGDFEPVNVQEDEERFWFVLEAIKPARLSLTSQEVAAHTAR